MKRWHGLTILLREKRLFSLHMRFFCGKIRSGDFFSFIVENIILWKSLEHATLYALTCGVVQPRYTFYFLA